MLKLRLISAAILIPLVVYGVLNLSTGTFALITAGLFLAGMWEWSLLIPLQTVTARVAFVALVAVLLWLLYGLPVSRAAWPVLLPACVWWVWALVWITRPQLCAQRSQACLAMKILAGVMVCVPAWLALVMLHGDADDGPRLVLGLLIMVWLADSGAYFAGRALGRHKLAPLVSPGKTWEGVLGGLLASVLFAGVAGWLHSGSWSWALAFVTVALVAMLFSVVGDLLESLMKRQSGIKDSGQLIPGHGGIFDRIDSLVAAAPLFSAGYLWLAL